MNSPKYNRTPHFSWSLGCTNDDKIATDISLLINNQIIITEKMDGSNTSLEAEGCFARTHSGPPTHPSFNGLKALHAAIKDSIEPGTQLFGEWCFALHSIAYSALPSYFMMFGVRYLNNNTWGSWNDVCKWSNNIGVVTVPELYNGVVSSEKELQQLVNSFMNQTSVCGGIREGVVVRTAAGFEDENFSKCVVKCVRANHVQTTEHWKDQVIIKNKLIV